MARVQVYFDGTKNPCAGDRVAYCLGTDYARTLKRFANVVEASRGMTSLQARKVVATAIVKTLPSLRTEILKYKNNEYFSPEQFFTMLKSSVDGLRGDEKDFLEEIVIKSNGGGKKAKAAPASLRPSEEDHPKNPSATMKPFPVAVGGE
jgi:hypothetical protein